MTTKMDTSASYGGFNFGDEAALTVITIVLGTVANPVIGTVREIAATTIGGEP